GLLAFTGLTLTTLGTQKNLSMSETFAFDFASYYFPAIWAYVFGAIAITGFGAGIIYSKLRRHREGLSAPSWTSAIVRIVLLAAIVFGFLILVNQDFGLAMPFFLMMVIGGTSLFGGRGSAWAAVLGALVVGAINNGLYLIGFNSDAQQIITALVLLTAVVV